MGVARSVEILLPDSERRVRQRWTCESDPRPAGRRKSIECTCPRKERQKVAAPPTHWRSEPAMLGPSGRAIWPGSPAQSCRLVQSPRPGPRYCSGFAQLAAKPLTIACATTQPDGRDVSTRSAGAGTRPRFSAAAARVLHAPPCAQLARVAAASERDPRSAVPSRDGTAGAEDVRSALDSDRGGPVARTRRAALGRAFAACVAQGRWRQCGADKPLWALCLRSMRMNCGPIDCVL